MPGIVTPRLELLPATVALLDAELESHAKLASLLNAHVPDCWPPGEYDTSAIMYFRDRMTENADAVGWYGWYALTRLTGGGRRTLIGAGGFLGPPDAHDKIEIGYSVVRAFEGRGYATELVRALADHAFATGRVKRIVARTKRQNVASTKVLDLVGFRVAGPWKDPGSVEYVLEQSG